MDKAVETLIAGIVKANGQGSLLSLGSKVGVAWPHIPTGIPDVDNVVCGIGGVPRGRITEIYGPESSGKTTAALRVVASAQDMGGLAAYVDMENALDPTYARDLGVHVDDLLVSQPDYGEQAFNIVNALVRSKLLDVIVIDSVAALVPKVVLDAGADKNTMMVLARMMSTEVSKLSLLLKDTKTAVIFINQLRSKPAPMPGMPTETTTGGRTLAFYCSLRLDVRRIGAVKDGDKEIGNRVRFKAVKNKLATPKQIAEIDLIWGEGFDAIGNVFDSAVEAKVIEKSGSWFSFNGERIGQGRLNALSLLRETPEMLAAVKTLLEGEDVSDSTTDETITA